MNLSLNAKGGKLRPLSIPEDSDMTINMLVEKLKPKMRKVFSWLSVHPFWNYWFPVIFLTGLEYYFSSQSHLPQPPVHIANFDKLEHITMYAPIGFFARRAFKQTKIPFLSEFPGFCAFVFCVFYGFSDEIYQSFVPNRDTDIYDVLSDSIGGFIGQWVHFTGKLNKLLKYIL